MATTTQHFTKDRVFTRKSVEALLNAAKGKTLGEVDKCGIIKEAYKARNDKVVRGIAGDVIEVSVLGCQRDSYPEPDILVDNVRTELKTTGVRKPREKEGQEYEAKEPLTITGVAPDTIINEEFFDSRFYHKLEHLLFVFYHYSLDKTASNSLDYLDFLILGYLFWEVPQGELETLKNDWLLVKDFVKHHSFEDEEARHRLKDNLMLIDYASPHQPRFRLKRTYVSTIVDSFLHKEKVASLPQHITKFSYLDKKCRQFTEAYRGKTIDEISQSMNIYLSGKDKDTCQKIIVSMFGGDASSVNQIRDFNAIGLIAKTIILTHDGKRTEDTKLFGVDFQEFLRKDVSYAEMIDSPNDTMEYSHMYSYFAEHSFIFIVFQEPYEGKNIPLTECRFQGFKRFSFDESFIFNDVYRCWNDARQLVFNGELKEIRSGGGFAPNFPKSKTYNIFFRGSGTDGTDKKPLLQRWGVHFNMYNQWIWIKGKYIVDKLKDIPYL